MFTVKPGANFPRTQKPGFFSVGLKRRRRGRNEGRVLWTLIQLHWSFLLLSDLLCHRNLQHARGISNKYSLDTFNRFVASVLAPTISSYLNGAHMGYLAVCCIEYMRLTNRRQRWAILFDHFILHCKAVTTTAPALLDILNLRASVLLQWKLVNANTVKN